MEERGSKGKLRVCEREQERIHHQEISCPYYLPSLYFAFLHTDGQTAAAVFLFAGHWSCSLLSPVALAGCV